MSIPRVGYSILMDTRKKAAQATIKEFMKPMPISMSNGNHVYSDSETSSSGGQSASNSKSQSPASLMLCLILNPYILDFIFRMMTRCRVVYVLVRRVLLVGDILLILIWRSKNCVNFIYCRQEAFSNIVRIRVVPITAVLCIIMKNWISNQVKFGLMTLLLMEIKKEPMKMKDYYMILSLIESVMNYVLDL